ncbi:MAG: hypothetical protein FJ271_16680 [Planctomycetes bacterium]|nr:hypothetical protein [Planctomycetota bacterium]
MRNLLGLIVGVLLAVNGAAQTGKVAFRDDGTILTDGKPFFPIGLYYCSEEIEDASGKLLSRLKDIGFNTLGYYRWGQPAWQKELDRIHQAGMKVWIRGENGFAIDTPQIEKAALKQVREIRNHPALLFWEFQDEPILNTVSIEGSRKGYQLVKREDPHHPLLVVEWPGAVSRFHLWKGIGDLFATDLYPIPRSRGYGRLPNHDITQMRDYLEALKKAHGDRPRMLVLQAWNWEPLKYGTSGYPTLVESRFMAYQAVIHGAKGLHYYGQVHCTRPNSASGLWSEAKDPKVNRQEFEKCLQLNRRFWDEHKPFFQELARASTIFLLREAEPKLRIVEVKRGKQASATASGIEFLTKQDGKSIYLLSVNANAKPRTATFQLPTSAQQVAEVHVLFENRTIPVKNGRFSDDFQAYATHVYATTSALPRP